MYICGQKRLLNVFDLLIQKERFPRFFIMVGDVGFGKKLLCDYIARGMGLNLVPSEISVAGVRDVIDNSYALNTPSLYMFADCDYMSNNAQNALLKVTEEPPSNCYFVMTVRNIGTVLQTLISRSFQFYLDPYTRSEIHEFMIKNNASFDARTKRILDEICSCPNDVSTFSKQDIKSIYELAQKFIQFIGESTLSNELKVPTMLSTKADDGKMLPELFLRCVILAAQNGLCETNNSQNIKTLHKIIKQTGICLKDISAKGSNKQMCLDNWIIQCHIQISGGIE